jgi:DNA (cytosine-5)-methyltransferase 1
VTFGSLCSGVGGFDLGLERAGLTCRYQVETDPFCRAVLAKHWPYVKRYDDVRTVRHLERTDVIVAGWPCQPVSSASHHRRRGAASPQWLWPEVLRLVDEGRPTWFVGENVTALDRGELDTVVSDLEGIGYEVAPTLEVPACAFGFDHWRPRLWILGYANGDGESRLPVDAEVARVSWPRDDAGSMGTADGISRGLHGRRMAALGNAIVPDIAEWIGRGLMRATSERAA